MSSRSTMLDRVVWGSVEETLNALLDAEADRLCNAHRYERSAARRGTRAGHYERNLQTKAGEVRLKVPKLRHQTFETASIERYRRRESSVEEALIEMYPAGVSVRPNLADLEVTKRNQVSREGVAMTETMPSPLNNVMTIDDERIKNHLDRVVRGRVEETLNALLDAEAEHVAYLARPSCA
jgi:hypothetical protein